MPNTTSNYSLLKPLVNDATDEDLWGGYLNDSMDLIDTQMKVNADATTLAVVGNLIYPIGSIYANEAVSTNPGTLLGFGTWVAITDKFIIGASGTYATGTTGGSATHTNTTGEMVAHTHAITEQMYAEGGTVNNNIADGGSTPGATLSITTDSAGSGTAYSILNPYHAAYIWRRTA